nr:hypothetical protein [Tanacetum cinerariifolium]
MKRRRWGDVGNGMDMERRGWRWCGGCGGGGFEGGGEWLNGSRRSGGGEHFRAWPEVWPEVVASGGDGGRRGRGLW